MSDDLRTRIGEALEDWRKDVEFDTGGRDGLVNRMLKVLGQAYDNEIIYPLRALVNSCLEGEFYADYDASCEMLGKALKALDLLADRRRW